MCGESCGYPVGVLIFQLILMALIVVGLWKLFVKAGQPGWAAIIPLYNTIVMIQIAGKPIWWIILLFIPIVSLVISVLIAIGLAKNFGRGAGTAVGLVFLPFIFMLILAFGSAEYTPVEQGA